MHVARETKIGWVDNLVCAGVVEDGLGVDARLVREGAKARDGVVEGGVDLDGFGDEVFELCRRVQGLLGCYGDGDKAEGKGELPL